MGVKKQGLNVVVIEDEPSIADTLRYALTSEGFSVEVYSTVRAGREALANKAIGFVILDVGLPDGSGFDLLRELRATSRIPVLMLTARADEVDRIVGLEIGADDYVVKPFSPREVVARVRAILRRFEERTEGEGAAHSECRHPEFAVDEHRVRISFRGHDLALSRYEFRLLQTLVSRPGWVFSREKLMELCWEAPEASMDRTVDTHIKTIRSKLRELAPDEEIVITHRGIGYSLAEPK